MKWLYCPIAKWLKKPFNHSAIQPWSSGFTLIELLVVIGILGILASALVATIDPFEQLKKGNDTKKQNTTVEFQTANVRYYVGQSAFPWETTTSPAACQALATDTDIAAPVNLVSAGMSSCLDELISGGELKTGFQEVTGVLDFVWVTEVNNTLQVCYLPLAKGGQKDKAAKYVPTPLTGGTPTSFAPDPGTTCKANGGTADCYWCTQ